MATLLFQATNRAASETSEKELEELGAPDIRPGTEWERVARLCDFNPKAARNVKDISRLRWGCQKGRQKGVLTAKLEGLQLLLPNKKLF